MATQSIKKVSVDNSLEESRKIINENFGVVDLMIQKINQYTGLFLENLKLPQDPLGNVKYVLRYDVQNGRYVVEPDSVVGSTGILDIVQQWSGEQGKNVTFMILQNISEYEDLDVEVRRTSIIYVKETRDVIICDRNLTNFTKEGIIQDMQNFFTEKNNEFAKSIKDFEGKLKSYKMGILRTFSTIEDMRSTTNPVSEKGEPLEDGNLVAIYNKANSEYEHNGKLFSYNPTATDSDDRWIEVGKLSQTLGNRFTDEEKLKVSIIKNDGEPDMFLSANGSYRRIIVPSAPIQKIVVNGNELTPSEDGTVRIDAGKGSVKSVQIGTDPEILPNEDGVVKIPVDVELDENSQSPISNAIVAQEIGKLKRHSVSSLDAELSEDGQSVVLSLYDEVRGEKFGSVTIPAGGGGGGGGQIQKSKLILQSELTKKHIRLGDTSSFSYTYDYKNADGESTGIRAKIEVTVKNGALTLFSKTYEDVSAGTYGVDINDYLREGTIDIYVKCTIRDEEGETKTKQTYQSLRVYDIRLETSYKLSTNGQGYESADTIIIPFRVTGAGDKNVKLLMDGTQLQSQSVTKSGVTNGSFSIPAGSIVNGIHTMTLTTDVSVPGTTIHSNSIIFHLRKGVDLYKPFALFMFDDKVGRTYDAGEQIKMVVAQFEEFSFNYYVYDPSKAKANIRLSVGDQESSIIVDRIDQTYTNRFIDRSPKTISIKTSSDTFSLPVVIERSSMDIDKVVDSMSLELMSGGRSNTESNPATWTYKGITTAFHNVNFSSSGWKNGSLSLVNGASIEINHKPFETDPTITGKTFEFEFSTNTISDKTSPIIHSLDQGVGISITPISARIQTSSGVRVETKFSTGRFYKIAFVLSKKTETRILEIYVDGVRCGAVQYPSTDSILHKTPRNIVVDSSSANVDLRTVRIYDRALQDDEILMNYIIDRPNPSDIVRLYRDNDVLDDSGAVSMQKLLAKGKSVMKMKADIALVDKTNNKKFEVPLDVDFFSKFGKEFSFELRHGRVRIQGTSSTTYPRKNYRLYFDVKKKDAENTLTVGGVLKEKRKYAFKPNSPEVGLFTMKADFAESSSTHNSGVAIIINDVFKQCGFLVPPQKQDINVRIGVDGQPCDMFVDNLDGNVKYIGKYNFNNDKAKSDHVYGFSGDSCTCLEFLNNSNAVGLFQTDDMNTHFKNGLEFRYPEDMTWEQAGDRQRHVRRLWSWIKSCVGRPDKFKREVRDYFDINFLCGWYVMTEYFMMVDQRVKNMMFATWDGNIWYLIPYDNDTILGVRNDGKLIYDYDIDQDTYDASIQNFAYAGHDSELWKLVRQALQNELQETAQKIRSVMSKEYVLNVLNEEFMNNWSKRIYNKDSEHKYIKPLLENNLDYLYSLQGNRESHRQYIINNRFDLLDAKYLAGTYRSDNIRIYFSHNFSQDNKEIHIKASEQYNFGYGFTSGAPKQSGILANDKNGYKVSLRFFMDLIVNDPQFIYGASRMQEIDFREVSKYILNNIDFSSCKTLKKLDISCADTNTTLQSLTLTGCQNLEELNVQGLQSDGFTSLDLSGNIRLRKFDGRRTKLQSISFASGSLIEELWLPRTFTFLQLRGLRNLRWENVHFEDKSKITKLWIENCDNIRWEDIIQEFPNLQNIRIYGVSKKGRIDFLEKYKLMGGITIDGSLRRESGFVGKYELENFLEESELEKWQRQYPELSILQPEYSVIAVTESIVDSRGLKQNVLDPQRLSNLDNETGYLYNKPYVMSGHVKKIVENRRKYRGKEEERGKMVVFPLHDKHSGKYDTNENPDLCEVADIDVAESGGIWVHEPQSWRKGVYDYETDTDYFIWSSNLEEPRRPEGKKFDFVWFRQNAVKQIYVQPRNGCVGKNISQYLYKYRRSISDGSEGADYIGHVKIDVGGFKRVKFPMMNRGYHNEDNGSIGVTSPGSKRQPGGEYYHERTWNIGACFTDADGKIIKFLLLNNIDFSVMNLDFGCAVPADAKYLYTSILTDFLPHEVYEVWLTNSDSVADWEPDWTKQESMWVAHNPLVYSTNDKRRQSHPGIVNAKEHDGHIDTRYNKNQWIFKQNTSLCYHHNPNTVANFMRRHASYRSIDRIEAGYFWHLVISAYGRFDYANITGCSSSNIDSGREKFFTDPRIGVNDSRCIGTDGVYNRSRLQYVWDDEFGQKQFNPYSQSQILCYGWMQSVVFMTQARNKDGIDYSGGSNMNHLTYFNNYFYTQRIGVISVQKSTTYSPVGSKDAFVVDWQSTNNGENTFVRSVNSGKKLSIVPRSYTGANEYNGCCLYFHNQSGYDRFGNDEYNYVKWKTLGWGTYVPIYLGNVVISNNLEEFKSLKHYKFLYDERFVPDDN